MCVFGFSACAIAQSAQLTYLGQFRLQDAFARVNTPSGQANQSNIAEAPNYGPFLSQFTLNAAKGSGSSMINPFQESTLDARAFRVHAWTSGWSNVASGGSDTGLTFAHNVFSIAFRSNADTTLLIEAVQVQIQTPGMSTINAIDIQRNLTPHTYFPSATGTLGAVIPIDAGANYRVATGVDLSGIATATIPSVSGFTELRISAELGTTVPTNFVALAGNLAGDVQAVSYDDGNVLSNQCDDASPFGIFQVSGLAATTNPSELTLRWKSSSTHPSCLEMALMFDTVTKAYVAVTMRVPGSVMSVHSASVPNPQRYVGAGGAVSTQLSWVPMADIDAGDGWSNSLDFIRWTAH